MIRNQRFPHNLVGTINFTTLPFFIKDLPLSKTTEYCEKRSLQQKKSNGSTKVNGSNYATFSESFTNPRFKFFLL